MAETPQDAHANPAEHGYNHRRMGDALRIERSRTGLSLTEAASRAGIGKSTLSVLESGAGNPSVETLWALASVYDIPLSRIIDPPAPDVEVTRVADLSFLESGDSAYRVALVTAGQTSRRRDLFYVTAEPGAVKTSDPHPRGTVEYVLITTGVAVVGVQGHEVRLNPGDCIRYPGDLPHSFEALEPGTTGVNILES
jgi:transcriptional regulator with XRE-family HTH domain